MSNENSLENAFNPLNAACENAARINGRKFGNELLAFIDDQRSNAYKVGVARALREWSDSVLGESQTELLTMKDDEAKQFEMQSIEFGQFRGNNFRNVPIWYLAWVADSSLKIAAYLRSDIGKRRIEINE